VHRLNSTGTRHS